MPQKDDKVRLCGDYKATINPSMRVDEHPLPTIGELFSTMTGGNRFPKIDLSRAYIQLEIHPDDRHLLTLSTHNADVWHSVCASKMATFFSFVTAFGRCSWCQGFPRRHKNHG